MAADCNNVSMMVELHSEENGKKICQNFYVDSRYEREMQWAAVDESDRNKTEYLSGICANLIFVPNERYWIIICVVSLDDSISSHDHHRIYTQSRQK